MAVRLLSQQLALPAHETRHRLVVPNVVATDQRSVSYLLLNRFEHVGHPGRPFFLCGVRIVEFRFHRGTKFTIQSLPLTRMLFMLVIMPKCVNVIEEHRDDKLKILLDSGLSQR